MQFLALQRRLAQLPVWGQRLSTRLQPAWMPPLPETVTPLLLINYYNKSGAAAHAKQQRQHSPGDEALRLAAACSVHAFSPTTRHPLYLPLLLEQHARLRLLVQRLLEASTSRLHVAFLYDLKRPGPSVPAPTPNSELPAAAGAAAAASNPSVGCSDPSSSCADLLSSGSEAGSSSREQLHSECTDEAVELPGSFTHVVLSGGNYKANDIDVARRFSRLPSAAKMFGICCGFQLLMRWHFDDLLDKMPAKVVGPRDVSPLFERCGAGGWAGCRSAAQFSHQYQVPAPAVQARVAGFGAAACLTLVHDGTLVLGFQLGPTQGVQHQQGVQYHPECGDAAWELVMHFLKS